MIRSPQNSIGNDLGPTLTCMLSVLWSSAQLRPGALNSQKLLCVVVLGPLKAMMNRFLHQIHKDVTLNPN